MCVCFFFFFFFDCCFNLASYMNQDQQHNLYMEHDFPLVVKQGKPDLKYILHEVKEHPAVTKEEQDKCSAKKH